MGRPADRYRSNSEDSGHTPPRTAGSTPIAPVEFPRQSLGSQGLFYGVNQMDQKRLWELEVERFEVRQADAWQWLETIPDESLDLVVTDPPYESLEKHRAKGTTTRLKDSKASSNKWFGTIPNELLPGLCREIYRVTKPDRHVYLICDHETAWVLKPAMEAAGFKFWKPIIWDKMAIGMGYHYRARYEVVLFGEKGKRKLNDLSIPDILTHKRVHGGIPAEKPVGLLKDLIGQSTQPGEVVADPFMGSGSAGAAALELGRRFVGCDINSALVSHVTKRLL